MATVSKYQTASGTTLYRVRYRTPTNRQTDKRGFKTKRAAEDFRDQLGVDTRRGAYVSPAAGRVKLGAYAAEWLASKHDLKPSTRARYKVVLDGFIADHAAVQLGSITRGMVRTWVADLSAARSPATVHKTIGVLRQVLAMAVEDNRLVANPVDGVALPTVATTEQKFLTVEQLHALADAAGDHRGLVYMLGTCGLRFGEAAELRWRDIDLDQLRIRITRSVTLVEGEFIVDSPKGGKPRTVSLPEFVAGQLTPGDAEALVFPDSAGGYMRGSNVRSRWWAQAVEHVGLFPRTETNPAGEPVTVYELKLHELRHTAASLAIQAGAHIKTLQNMLGHESAALTLDRYGHLYESDVGAVGLAVNRLITRDCGQSVGTAHL